MENAKNFMQTLLDEMNRVRGLIAEYKSLPNNAGFIGASLMQLDIQRAEKAIADDNVIEMLVVYDKLKSCE